jgi:23S rRNA pseudouridine1911/1915/1917 synthase
MKERGAFTITADASVAGQRLDVVIAVSIPDCSRSFSANLITGGDVRVNGSAKKPGYRVKAGDEITGRVLVPKPVEFVPEPVEIKVLYQDVYIVVVNKQAGLVVHPAPGHPTGTLVNGLLYQFPELQGTGDALRPGIVHRLDKDTSGTLVVAKTPAAHENLSAQFKSRSVRKEYSALVYGKTTADSGVITFSVGRHPRDRKKMSIRSRKPREAETFWQVQERFQGSTLLTLDLKTGRTHQIRVHCAAIGHPLVGDAVYGGRKKRLRGRRFKENAEVLAAARRQMLHARRLEFAHPATEERMSFVSPLPDDMKNLLQRLREYKSR